MQTLIDKTFYAIEVTTKFGTEYASFFKTPEPYVAVKLRSFSETPMLPEFQYKTREEAQKTVEAAIEYLTPDDAKLYVSPRVIEFHLFLNRVGLYENL